MYNTFAHNQREKMETRFIMLIILGQATIILENYDPIKGNNVEKALSILLDQTMPYIQLEYHLVNKL